MNKMVTKKTDWKITFQKFNKLFLLFLKISNIATFLSLVRLFCLK